MNKQCDNLISEYIFMARDSDKKFVCRTYVLLNSKCVLLGGMYVRLDDTYVLFDNTVSA